MRPKLAGGLLSVKAVTLLSMVKMVRVTVSLYNTSSALFYPFFSVLLCGHLLKAKHMQNMSFFNKDR